MRNKLSSLLLSLCITAIAIAQENTPPGWLSRLPLASNTTYMYVMERGNGATYNEAVNNAMLKVIRNTSLRIGVAIDISEVNKALQNGKDWDIVAVQHRIPINKVCEYRERKDESGFIVAVLCQVAKSGNVYPEFDEFIACYDNRTYSDEGALLKSVFIPGLGQMGKRHYGAGILTLLSETAFLGGAVGSYYLAKDKLASMKSVDITVDAFKTAKHNYENYKTANTICLTAAGMVYMFNLVRAYTMVPKYKKDKNKTAFYPTLIPNGDDISAGMGLTLNF